MVNHATGSFVSAAHSISRFVLPKPAGADTRVRGPLAPRLTRSVSRRRCTNPAGRTGMEILVFNNGGREAKPALDILPRSFGYQCEVSMGNKSCLWHLIKPHLAAESISESAAIPSVAGRS